jgi:hypothetical protein
VSIKDLYNNSRDELANTPYGNSGRKTLSGSEILILDPSIIYPDSFRDILHDTRSLERIRQVVKELTLELVSGEFT